MQTSLGVTIIVCCYNSAKRLPETLKHIAMQQVPDSIPWEVIVVDNASTDDTSAVAKLEWNKYKLDIPFLIVHQPNAGLSYAREKGLQVSRYDYCLFCDDDNWLYRGYVSTAYRILEERTNIGVLGGKGEAIFEHEEPTWFDKYKGFYAVGPQSELPSCSIKKSRRHVYGAGMIIRKKAYQDLQKEGFKSILSDRKGKYLVSGGDTELCLAIAIKGYDIYYDERLKFKHFIPENRTTSEYLVRLASSIGASWLYLHPYLYALHNRVYKPYILLKDIGFLLLSVTKAYFYFIRCLFNRSNLLEARMYVLSTSKAFMSIILGAKKYDKKLRLLLKRI